MMLQDSKEKRTYDAIVIGSGASGGWAAKELTEKGLKTLVLERGRMVRHIEDYPTASKAPWEFEFRGAVPIDKRSGLGAANWKREETMQWALAEDEQPYIEEKPFRLEDTMWEVSPCSGQEAHSAGQTLILRGQLAMAMRWIGRSGTKTWNPGIPMWRPS